MESKNGDVEQGKILRDLVCSSQYLEFPRYAFALQPCQEPKE